MASNAISDSVPTSSSAQYRSATPPARMKRVALFAHYDSQAEVKPYVVTLLRGLREVCDEIVFGSTAGLSEEELERVRPFCGRTLVRENFGYDFSVWRQALSDLDISDVDEVVLANSSVFGPIYPFAPIFEQMAEHDCDFWGMTDSFEIRWHVQSYFLVIKRRALLASAFSQFFNAVLPYRDKDQVIRSYELGLTRFLREHGLKPGAFVPMGSWLSSPALRARVCAKRRNATLYYPLQLLAAGMPLVKMQLLRDNPARVSVAQVRQTMASAGYDLSQVRFDRNATAPKSMMASVLDSFIAGHVESERPKI
jgi:lipopolysaccharide biosynthesis protein